MTVVYLTINLDAVLRFGMRLTPDIRVLQSFFRRQLERASAGSIVVFVRHLDRLHQILNYINKNEVGTSIVLVHCGGAGSPEHDESFKELERAVPILQQAGVFPHLHVTLLYKSEPFGPALVNAVAGELRIPKNRILIGSIHEEHQFDYQDFGGVRVIF
jgi:hypothetical protein